MTEIQFLGQSFFEVAFHFHFKFQEIKFLHFKDSKIPSTITNIIRESQNEAEYKCNFINIWPLER